MTNTNHPLPPILPVGTAVVVRVAVKGAGNDTAGDDVTCSAGAVGVIIRSPADAQHSYRVRLPGGEEITLRREELQPLKHFQREGMSPGMAVNRLAHDGFVWELGTSFFSVWYIVRGKLGSRDIGWWNRLRKVLPCGLLPYGLG